MVNDTSAIRERMVGARKAAGLSQVALGKRLVMGASTVSGYETGRFELTLEVLQGYERETGRPLEWIVRGDTQALSRAELLRLLSAEQTTQAEAGKSPDFPLLSAFPGFAAFAADASLLSSVGATPEEVAALGAHPVLVGQDPDKEQVLGLLLYLRGWSKQRTGGDQHGEERRG